MEWPGKKMVKEDCKCWWLLSSVGEEAHMFIEVPPCAGPCATGELKLSPVEELDL